MLTVDFSLSLEFFSLPLATHRTILFFKIGNFALILFRNRDLLRFFFHFFGSSQPTTLNYSFEIRWGDKWGEAGYMKIKRGVNMCGLSNFAAYAVV